MSITVSVVIPAYNAGKYIGRAIDSVLAQTRPADEIIVVDDGSTDNTAEVAHGYGDKVRFIRQENAGASVARNTGIEAATGEWIAFLDADDEWLPQKLKLQTEHLRRNPDLVWTTGNFIRCYCDTDHRENDLKGERLKKAKAILGEKEYFDTYFQAYQAYAKGSTITMMIQRKLLVDTGMFTPGLLRYNDVDMWFRIAYQGANVGYVFESLAIAHRNIPNSIVKTHLNADIVSCFIDNHLRLASKHNILEEAKPCVTNILSWRIHLLLEANRGDVVREMLRRHGNLYSKYFRTTVFVESLFPRTGLLYHKLKKKLPGSLRKLGSVFSGK